jgi:hypothetical protein
MKTMLPFLCSTLVAGIVCVQAQAQAWEQRINGFTCYGAVGPIAKPPNYAGIPVGQENYCPFVTSDTTPDDSVSQITVDITSSGTAPADAITAEACVFSGWLTICGKPTDSPAFTAHTGVNISDLSAWTGDTAGGYAFVWIQGNNSVNLAGIYVAGS